MFEHDIFFKDFWNYWDRGINSYKKIKENASV